MKNVSIERLEEIRSGNGCVPLAIEAQQIAEELLALRQVQQKPVIMDSERWCPHSDPITGDEFFLWLEHPTLGYVPTYGGPLDSYTLTERDENCEFFHHRYDHDAGAWVDDEAVYLLDDSEEQPAPIITDSERQQYRAEGIIFAANRLLAAWDAGFIDKSASDTLDVATMILSALEMLPDAPEGDYQRGFADEMLKFLREEVKKTKAAESN